MVVLTDDETRENEGDLVLPAQFADVAEIDRMVRAGELTEPPCAPDLDADGQLTLFDFLAFQTRFDAGSLEVDFDGDGQLTIFDFLAFQNAFDSGCP